MGPALQRLRSPVLEDKVFEYVGHRMNQGVDLTDVVGEKYVRRNAFGREIDNKRSNPRIVDAARKHLQEVFRSEELDFDKRRSNETG